ncbi:hypothetical protein G7046_g3512 [Stylonectria norvegica]|nr:hypothetical protein G7046_g3512 [Stylonectria norvegica]
MARGRPRAVEVPEARGPTASPTASVSASVNDHRESIPPFYNTTFSTHRVSPLYIGSNSLTSARLETIANRLRDTLVGDVVRGIQIGLEATDTPMGQVGALKAVHIRWFRAGDVLGEATQQRPGSRDLGSDQPEANWGEQPDREKQGLWIEIKHENAAYVAILLPGLSRTASTEVGAKDWTAQAGNNVALIDENPDRFLHLPLLLLRMPLSLKTVVSDWLSTTFDCRVSKMTLGTKTIACAWESWVKTAGLPDRGPDFVLTLAFNAPLRDPDRPSSLNSDELEEQAAPGLRSVDITISPQDLRRFVQAGATIRPSTKTNSRAWETDARERRRLAGGNLDDGWAWRSSQDETTYPFTEALGRYLDHHLALNLFHPSVRITQISCAGFVLGQNRLKILKPGESEDLHRAAWMFVEQFGEKIQRGQLPPVFSVKGIA